MSSDKVKYEPVPLDEPPRFPSRPRCNDLAWTIIFLVQLVTTLVVGLYYFGINYASVTTAPPATTGSGSLHFAMRNWLLINSTFALIFSTLFASLTTLFIPTFRMHFMLVCLFLSATDPIAVVVLFGGIFVSVLWLYLMRKSPQFIIWFSLSATIALCLGLTIFFFYKRRWVAGTVFLVALVLLVVLMFFVEGMMTFSIAVLEIVIEFLERFPQPLFIALLFVCVQAAWLCLWLLCTVGVLFAISNSGGSAAVLGFAMFLLAVAFYWTSQVVKNIVHLTTAGTLATWYFNDNDQLPDTPTLNALNRAMTTSFGSICLGSLLVALIRAVRFMVTAAGTHNDCLRACGELCLSWIDSIVQFFNQYAFTKCAVYGFTYCESSREVWNLLKRHGLMVVINNDLIGVVLAIGAILGGVLAAVFAGGVAYQVDSARVWVYVVIGFLIGLSLTMCAMEVVDSAVAAIVVCFADDPNALSQTHPAVYQKLRLALLDCYHIDVRQRRDNNDA